MKKLLAIVLAVFFANAALAAESRLSGSNASSNSSSSNSSTPDGSEGWQISVGAHLSKFKVSDEEESYTKNNTPFSIAIAKEIAKRDSGDWLLEFSLMTAEKWDEKASEIDYYYGAAHTISATFEIETEYALFASLYYQFNTLDGAFKPYIGAGLGLASIKPTLTGCVSGPYVNGCVSFLKTKDNSDDSSSITGAFQFSLGANYFFTKNVAAGLGWGYRNYGSIKIEYDDPSDNFTIKVSSSGLFGKLTYRF
ncbi:MAG: outer membrane beta-barrel protein [Helicobacteraceae bacterium]|jgi:opacity protein-like surface antigen|nr:outer membrane beta-barrel protein [Helicobacteraceae bacterium]